MGNKKLGLLLMIFIMYFHIFAASSPIEKGLPSDMLQHEHGIRKANGEKYVRRSGVAHKAKIARGVGFGARTAGSTASGEHRTNGVPGTPYAQGGAQINHHPNIRHGAGSCNRNCVGLLTFIMNAVASLVHLYIGWKN
ncbi:hypothetical protein AB3S75_034659 [Citrus x aurantiifolia]